MREFGEVQPPHKPRNWWPLLILAVTFPVWGCAIYVAGVLIIVALVMLLLMPLTTDWASQVPAPLRAKPLCHYAEGFGPNSINARAIYSLPADVSADIQRMGLDYFRTMPQPTSVTKDPYAPWRKKLGKIPTGKIPDAFGCKDNKPLEVPFNINELKDSTTYVTITQKAKRGVITVIPERRLMTFDYEDVPHSY